jgi:hypothetical protein
MPKRVVKKTAGRAAVARQVRLWQDFRDQGGVIARRFCKSGGAKSLGPGRGS